MVSGACCRHLDRLLQLTLQGTGAENMKEPPQKKGGPQFTRDDVARFCASTVNTVLEQLSIQHMVEGIAVFPQGEDVFLIDVVMRDLTRNKTWSVSITIPPPQEKTDARVD